MFIVLSEWKGKGVMRLVGSTVDNKKKMLMDRLNILHSKLVSMRNKEDVTGEQPYHFDITKADYEKHDVYGWVMWSRDADGNVEVDSQNDIIEPDELEEFAHKYLASYGDVGQLHITSNDGYLIESIVFTKDKQEILGIENAGLPIGWFAGFHITNDEAWEKIKDGTYTSFSIEGGATRVEVDSNNIN